MKVYAKRIVISGDIGGNVRFYGKEIIILPGATLRGDLFYTSPQALPADQLARVSGSVQREQAPESVRRERENQGSPGWFSPVFFFSMLATGTLLLLIFPGAVQGAQQTIHKSPLRSMLTGLILLCAVPPLAILFMITVVGLPVGLGLLAIYPLALLLGYLAVAFYIARRAADAMKQPQEVGLLRQLGFLALALILLRLVAMIPLLGLLLWLLALVAGVGGWAVWLHGRYRATPPAGPGGAAPAWPPGQATAPRTE
jgi:hypothetical protein